MTVRNGRQRSGQKEAGKIWIDQTATSRKPRQERKKGEKVDKEA